MKAVRVNQWGSSEAAIFEDIECPQPQAGEVLVRVKAVSINPIDWKIREGYLQDFVSLPTTLGSDIAGDIESLGDGVEGLEVGTAVYGLKGIRGGAFAEYTTVKLNEIARKPETLTYTEAAAVPHTALTAWQALFDMAGLKEGQRVLIHAAAGGVGHFAVQFAKLKGAYVIGTASANNEALVRALGADEFVNYQTTRFEDVVKDVDVVLDTIGFDTSQRSCQVLKPGGVLVCFVTPPPDDAAEKYGIEAKYGAMQANSEQLSEIAQLIDDKQVKPYIQQVMRLDQVREALQLSQAQHVCGKLVLTIG
jgi:NADPH:quinone reductase-like Zn-dependent oxidoreductase